MATDVAGRGIDIHDVSMVVNYDMAKNIEGESGPAWGAAGYGRGCLALALPAMRPCLTPPPPCRLHPPHRADRPSREERCSHHLPHQGRLHRLLRPEAGHPGEPGVLLPARAGQPPRCPAQAWHHPHQEAAGGNHLRLSPWGWCPRLRHRFRDDRTIRAGGCWDFSGRSFPRPPDPCAAGTATNRDWGRDCPKMFPLFSQLPSPPPPQIGGAAGGCLGAGFSLSACCRRWGRTGAGLRVLVFRQGCPRSRGHFIPFLAETPGCRNKPAAALLDVASSSSFLRCRPPLCAISPHPPALPEVPAASSVPKGRAFGCSAHISPFPLHGPELNVRVLLCPLSPPAARDTDTATSEHSCVSQTGYREISAFYKRNYNKSVAPTRCPRAGSLRRAPGGGLSPAPGPSAEQSLAKGGGHHIYRTVR